MSISDNRIPERPGAGLRYRWFALYACGCTDLQPHRQWLRGVCPCHDTLALTREERRLPTSVPLGDECRQGFVHQALT